MMKMNNINYKELKPLNSNGLKLYIETYGCQMNANDSEVMVAIMQKEGYTYTKELQEADIILINTCSIRDNAEQRIWGRLGEFTHNKRAKKSLVVGIVGCMAERLKEELLERRELVDIVVGPDAYRSLPQLVAAALKGKRGVNVELSMTETYDNIQPVRLDENEVSAFISIMRGCNNMCTYCVVPYTRGRERSRDPKTILEEAKTVFAAGYREVTLLGQNVNSYKWEDYNFPALMRDVAEISPLLRVRFATSHPKDISDELIETIAKYPNICKSIHLPAQSGSSRMLQVMNRRYTREWYLERVAKIKELIPECAITTDIIAGFCTETESDHAETVSLMKEVGYDFSYMFYYSERPGTKAAKTMADDVPQEVKTKRLTEIINLQGELSLESNRRDIGKCFEVLIEGRSKKSEKQLNGRTTQNKMVVFDGEGHAKGEYVTVKIESCTAATLKGSICN